MSFFGRGVMATAVSAADLDLSTWGTFTRTTEASYFIGAPTTGAAPFIGWAPKDVRRIDRRNATPRYLTEGQRTNALLSTEDMQRPGGAWTVGSNTPYTTLFPSPDGCSQKGRWTTGSGVSGVTHQHAVTPSLDWVAYSWHRSPSGTTSYQNLLGGTVLHTSGSTSLGTTWTRADMWRLPDNAFGTLFMGINAGDNLSGSGGLAAGARDAVTWGMQQEQASFPSSYIRTVDYNYGAATRGQDILSGPIASIPAKMIDGEWTFTCAPVGASARMIRQNATQVLFSYATGSGEYVAFVIDGGAVKLRVVSGGATKVTTGALTFSADQELTVTLDGAAGSIVVSGATTGNGTTTGTAWTRTVGTTLYVGALDDGTLPAFAGLWCTGAPTPTWSSGKRVVFVLGQSNATTNGMHDRVHSQIQQLHPDCKLIDGSMGGTSLAVDWASGGAQYIAAVAKWNAAVTADATLTGYTPIVVWIHGESDAANGAYAAAYGTNLAALKTNLEASIPQLVGAKWLVGQLPSTTTLVYGATSTTIGQVRTAQASFVSGLGSQAAIVDPSDLAFGPSPPDLHFSDASTHIYAARMGAAAESIGA